MVKEILVPRLSTSPSLTDDCSMFAIVESMISVSISSMECKYFEYISSVIITRLPLSKISLHTISRSTLLFRNSSTLCELHVIVVIIGVNSGPSKCGIIPWPGLYSLMRQWLARSWVDFFLPKTPMSETLSRNGKSQAGIESGINPFLCGMPENGC